MPRCVVAVSRNGELEVNRAYGLADLERGVPLSTNSVFDAASIRKQFVAAAILLLVEERRLSLSDDVRKSIPELPDYGHTITLDHMLTHTSGLRDWVPLLNWANGNYDAMTMIRARPYAPTAAELAVFTGRYVSDELRAVLEMTPGTRGLIVRINDSPVPAGELAPVDPDTFQRGMITVHFVRDGTGNVVAWTSAIPCSARSHLRK